jgi:stage V sporulation protein G
MSTEQKSTMTVTQCQVYPLREPMGKTRAMARVLLNDELQLTGLRVVEGANGLFVAYPNDPSYKGEDYRSMYYPVTRALCDHIEEVILEKYSQEMKG